MKNSTSRPSHLRLKCPTKPFDKSKTVSRKIRTLKDRDSCEMGIFVWLWVNFIIRIAASVLLGVQAISVRRVDTRSLSRSVMPDPRYVTDAVISL